MTSTLKPNFMSYEEWIKAHPEAQMQEARCDFCNGTGTDVCLCCGNDKDCDKCEGTGSQMTARAEYDEQLAKDKEAFERYIKTIGASA